MPRKFLIRFLVKIVSLKQTKNYKNNFEMDRKMSSEEHFTHIALPSKYFEYIKIS